MGVDPLVDGALRRRNYIGGLIESLRDKIEKLQLPDTRHGLEVSKYDAIIEAEMHCYRIQATEDISTAKNKLAHLFDVTRKLQETYEKSRNGQYAEYHHLLLVLCQEFYRDVVSSSEELALLSGPDIAKHLNPGPKKPGDMLDTAGQHQANPSMPHIDPYTAPPHPVTQHANSPCKSPASYQATQNADATISLEDTHPVIAVAADAPTQSSQIPSENGTSGPSKRRASKSSESTSKRQRTRRTVDFTEIHQPSRWETMPRILSKPARNSITFYILRCEEHPDVTFSHVRPMQMGNQHLRTEHGVEADMNKNPGKNLAYERLSVEVLGCNEELFLRHNEILDREIQKDVDRPIDPGTCRAERNMSVSSTTNNTAPTSNQQLAAEKPVARGNDQVQCRSSQQEPEENANSVLNDLTDETSEFDGTEEELYYDEVDDENDPDWEENSPTPTGEATHPNDSRYRTPARTRSRTTRESLVVTLHIPREPQQSGVRVAANREQAADPARVLLPAEGPSVKQESPVFPWVDLMSLDDEEQAQPNGRNVEDRAMNQESGVDGASAGTTRTNAAQSLAGSSITCMASTARPNSSLHTSLSFSPIDVPLATGGDMHEQFWVSQHEIERRSTQNLMDPMNRPLAPVAEMGLE